MGSASSFFGGGSSVSRTPAADGLIARPGYTYNLPSIIDDFVGLTSITTTVTGTYETFLDVTGPGIVQYLGFTKGTFINATVGGYGIRVTIDGTLVYDQSSVTITGYRLYSLIGVAGYMINTGPTGSAISFGDTPFNTNFKVEVNAPTSQSCGVLVNYILTS